MDQSKFDRAIEEGNENILAGFWWVRHRGELRVAEWQNLGVVPGVATGSTLWGWSFTRAEEARRVDEIIEFIKPPAPTGSGAS